MKRTVTITLTIDTDDYDDVATDLEAVDLVAAMIEGSADWPDDGHDIRIECGAASGIYGDL